MVRRMNKFEVIQAQIDGTLVETTKAHVLFTKKYRKGVISEITGDLVTIKTVGGLAGGFLYNEIQLFEKRH